MCLKYNGNKKKMGDITDLKGNVIEPGVKPSDAAKRMRYHEDTAAAKYPELPPQEAMARYLEELLYNLKYLDFLRLKKWKLKTLKSNYELVNEVGFILFRGKKEWLDKYIRFVKLPLKEQEKLLKEVYRVAKQNTGKVYKEVASNEKLREIDVQYYISTYQKGAKVTPDFSVMGFDMFMKNSKLGNGKYDLITVIGKYSEADILSVLDKIKKHKGVVKVNVTSNRSSDFKNCWKKLGINPTLGKKLLKELELTWHHLDDLDENLESSFQLVLREVHRETSQHLGSHYEIEQLLELIK